jgi:serine/threonine-protein kinase
LGQSGEAPFGRNASAPDGTRSAVNDVIDARDDAPPRAADPFIGRVLSGYRLEEMLAAGGMGVLYRATDLRLGRSVAVKILSRHLAASAPARARFEREARAASALDHPNIATVHAIAEDNGELLMVMALYDGETLKQRIERGALPVQEALAVLKQLALGLDAAHRAGIVHRDIKPGNVFVTRDGTVKILDFGVAKLASDGVAQGITAAGQTLGTILYMSPEQLRGQAVDARSDLWSLGVVAYEVLAGISPFGAESSEATAMRILSEEPPTLASIPGVPTWLAELVRQLLQKDPANRRQSAAVISQTVDTASSSPDRTAKSSRASDHTYPLHWRRMAGAIALICLTGAAAVWMARLWRQPRPDGAAAKSLVVLPFVNSSGSADAEYLSDGIAESLIDNLSQIPELRVIARNTAFHYKGAQGAEVDLRKLRRDLGADVALMGRVQQRGDTLVVHADLVNLGTGSQLWGEKYSRRVTDLVSVEEDIARSISERLRPRLAPEVQRRVTRMKTEDTEAYQLYLRGRYLWNKRTKESMNKAVEYFHQAIDRDPKYALAYAGLADSYSLLAYYSFSPWKETSERAEAAALKALSLDEGLAEAHAALGQIRMSNFEWSAADKELRRAIELNPNYAPAHNWLGLLSNLLGHLEEAKTHFLQAEKIDPASSVYGVNLGSLYCQFGEYERGIAKIEESMQLEEEQQGWARILRAMVCFVPSKMYREAIEDLKRTGGPAGPDSRALGPMAWAYALSGDRPQALTLLGQLKERDATADESASIAFVYDALGDKEAAFEWFEKAYQRRSRDLLHLKVARVCATTRSDPRYDDLLRRLGFPQ